MPGWDARLPWLCAGTTRRAADGRPDFGLLARDPPPAGALDSWRALRALGGWRAVALSRQVHGSTVRVHREAPEGILLADDGDGHATRVPGLLLAVTAADCAPVFLADPVRRAAALLHAGWRGAAGGVAEAGVSALRDAFGSAPADLLAHVGPAIGPCCFEVGAEVPAALESGRDRAAGGLPGLRRAGSDDRRAGRFFLDLGLVLQERLARAGLEPANVTRSAACTRCDARFFSHRRGDGGRHVAFAGILGPSGALGTPSPHGGRRRPAGPRPPPGLCESCAWSRRIATAKNSTFWLCRRHAEGGPFRKYPILPVASCKGFEEAGEASGSVGGRPS